MGSYTGVIGHDGVVPPGQQTWSESSHGAFVEATGCPVSRGTATAFQVARPLLLLLLLGCRAVDGQAWAEGAGAPRGASAAAGSWPGASGTAPAVAGPAGSRRW